MVVIIDADYNSSETIVAGVFAETINSSESSGFLRLKTKGNGEYISGQFYKRELQCVQLILEHLNLSKVDLIVVDGYADFGTDKMSLGQHVFELYHIPVIGVAKKCCQFCILTNTEITRGNSSSPLFITSCGISTEEAKNLVKSMHGTYRLPTLIKLADSYARRNIY